MSWLKEILEDNRMVVAEAGGGYIKCVRLTDHEQALAEKDREIQQIREHEFQRGYREGQASIMAKAVRFAKQCVQPIRGKAAILAAEEAQAFLKEHP